VKWPTNRHTKAAAVRELDRKAWNLPQASVRTASRSSHRDGLAWGSFRDLYYPASRRHNFEAIVAYGDYKRSPQASSPATEVHLKGDANSTDAPSREEWEAEGGTTP
jgi:hypothetical protein